MKGCYRALAAFLTVACTAALAQVAPAEINRQNEAIERQLQDRLKEEQQRAREAVPPRPAPTGIAVPRPDVPSLGVACRDIRVVRIEGATRLPAATLEGLQVGFSGRCLAVEDLERLLGELTKAYIDMGYVTTRAYLPAQDLRTGTLLVRVVEGTIERFEVDSPRAAAQWPPGAFPARPGDLLNLRELEQGIDNINRLGSNGAQLDLQPGSAPGQSVVVVRNRPQFPVRLFLTYDNLGTRATGKNALSATLSFDSLLGLNELATFTHRASVPHDPDHQSQSNALSFAVPWGWNSLGFDLSESRYSNLFTTAGGVALRSQGRTTVGGLTLDRVVYRDQASRFSLSGRLQVQDSRSWLATQYLGIASRQQTSLELAGSGFTAFAGGLLYGRLAFTRGLPVLGGLDDPAGLPSDLPHARFRKLNLDASYNRRFSIGQQPLLWASQVSAQHALDTLFGAQQFSVGGVSTVRGYLLNSLAGDSGLLWRNELAVPWSLDEAAGRVYVAFDIGSVRNRAPGVPSGSLSGVTVGTAFQFRDASVDVFASRAAHLPAGMQREPVRVGVRLSYSL